MTRSMQRWAWIGGLVGANILVVGVAYAVMKSNAAAPKSLAQGWALQPKHRYQIAVTDPVLATERQGDYTPKVQNYFDNTYGAGTFVVRSASLNGTTFTAVFDYYGTAALTISATSVDLPAGATIADLGAAP